MSSIEIQKVIIDDKLLRFIVIDDEKWFPAVDLYTFLGYRPKDACKIRASPFTKKKIHVNDTDWIIINTQGVKEFLLSSRKRSNKKLNEYFNVNTDCTSLLCKESNIGTVISKVFREINIVPQYKVLNGDTLYYIDFYLPDYRIAIEIDEFGHRDQSSYEEIERQTFIEAKLKCEFVRCNPDDKDFDIFDLIYEIRMLVKS